MNEKINIDLKSLKFILNKNKAYIFPIAAIFISIILFLQFVIPQFRALLEVGKEVRETSLRIKTQKANLNILTNIDEETLDSQLKILNSALPPSKDFIGMLNSIYSTAQKTGVNLGSFSFEVGDLTKSVSGDDFPVVKLSIPIVNSGVAGVNSFVEIINKAFPLSEVELIKIGGVSSVVNLSFYYKPLDASSYNQNVSISPISQKELMLINQLEEFENTPSFPESSYPVATSSAVQ